MASTAQYTPGRPGAARIDLLRGGPALRIVGDIDRATGEMLAHALALLPPAGECHLYLEEVDFVSLAGIGQLMRFAQHPGRHVVLHSPPRALLRVAAIAWPDYRPDVRP